MDYDDKTGVAEEANQEDLHRFDLCGVPSLVFCLHFVMMSQVITSVSDYLGVYLNDAFKILSSSDGTVVYEEHHLETAADNYKLSFCIYTIEPSETSFKCIKPSNGKQNERYACLLHDKINARFCVFYKHYKNGEVHTIFPMNDEYPFQVFEDYVKDYKSSTNLDMDTTNYVPHQSAPTNTQENNPVSSMNCVAGNSTSQSQSVVKASDVWNLLIQNIQTLSILIGFPLDISNLCFDYSKYKLQVDNTLSQEAIRKALRFQFQLISKLADLAAEDLNKNPRVFTSVQSSEPFVIQQNETFNNHREDIQRNTTIHCTPELLLNSHTTIGVAGESYSHTTDHTNETTNVSGPKLKNQPARYWNVRYLRDLIAKDATKKSPCPALQVEGETPSIPFEIEVNGDIEKLKDEAYLGVTVATYDGAPHDQNILVPLDASINTEENYKSNTLRCLKFATKERRCDEFNIKTKGIFLKINPDELQIKWQFKMISLYQEGSITKALILQKKLELCRLMFAIYIKLPNGEFKRVSPPTFSDLIQQVKKRTPSSKINSIFPNELCEKGGQAVFITFTKAVKEDELNITCNEKLFTCNDFKISGNLLSFESPAYTEGEMALRITIAINNSNPPINFQLPYYTHNEHLGPCGTRPAN